MQVKAPDDPMVRWTGKSTPEQCSQVFGRLSPVPGCPKLRSWNCAPHADAAAALATGCCTPPDHQAWAAPPCRFRRRRPLASPGELLTLRQLDPSRELTEQVVVLEPACTRSQAPKRRSPAEQLPVNTRGGTAFSSQEPVRPAEAPSPCFAGRHRRDSSSGMRSVRAT